MAAEYANLVFVVNEFRAASYYILVHGSIGACHMRCYEI